MKIPAALASALTAARRDAGELGNLAIDEYLAHRISRRELLRHASLLGCSSIALAAGALLAPERARAQGTAGANATIRVAHLTPAGRVDPLTVSDAAGLCLIAQTGEFLINDEGDKSTLTPALALSWKANEKGDVWTFKLRPNVKFHDGQPLSAERYSRLREEELDRRRTGAPNAPWPEAATLLDELVLSDGFVEFLTRSAYPGLVRRSDGPQAG